MVVSVISTGAEPVLQPASTAAVPSVMVIVASAPSGTVEIPWLASNPSTTQRVPSSGCAGSAIAASRKVIADPSAAVTVRLSPSTASVGEPENVSESHASWSISAGSHAIWVIAMTGTWSVSPSMV